MILLTILFSSTFTILIYIILRFSINSKCSDTKKQLLKIHDKDHYSVCQRIAYLEERDRILLKLEKEKNKGFVLEDSRRKDE